MFAIYFRRFFFVLVFFLSAFPAKNSAQESPSGSEKFLFEAANREREWKNLQPLKWDSNLAAAARIHLHKMVERDRLSHQFSGEPDLTKRAKDSGAHFSMVAENIAEAPSVSEVHIGWMLSTPHRENILNPKLNAIGIAVETRGTQYFAVQDFSTAVSTLSREEQEKKVGQLLQARGLQLAKTPDDARKACDSSAGFSGARPLAITHFEAPDLNQLPGQLIHTIKSGNYRTAAVGSCNADESAGFSRFRISILLYAN
jgi:hypothetical protein